MTTTKTLLETLALNTPARDLPTRTSRRHNNQRPVELAPRRTVAEVEGALQLIVGKYEIEGGVRPLEAKYEELLATLLKSRRSANAIVELGEEMARSAKRTAAGENWYYNTWKREMLARAEEGEEMAENTPEGASFRLGHLGREAVKKEVMCLFGTNLPDWLVRTAGAAIVGKRGANLLTAKIILSAIHGEEAINGWWKKVRDADKAAQATTDADTESDQDEVDSDEEAAEQSA